jgi:hypothetical protein
VINEITEENGISYGLSGRFITDMDCIFNTSKNVQQQVIKHISMM